MLSKRKKYLNLLIRIIKRIVFGPFDNFLKDSNGVIHIGANIGQEKDHYKKFKVKRVLWIEADPNTFKKLKKNIKQYKNQKALNYLLNNKKKNIIFNVSNFGGNASSIFNFSEHKKMHPDVKFTKKIMLKSYTFEEMIAKERIIIKDYNTLIMDTQGSELLILKGAKKFIHQFKYIKLETSDYEIYKKAPILKTITSFLKLHNFTEKKKIKIDESKNGGSVFDILYKKNLT